MLAIKDIYYLCQRDQAAHSESGEAVIIFYSRWGTEGYITLPNDFLLNFGKITSNSSSDKFMPVLFLKPYSMKVMSVLTGMEYNGIATGSGHGYIQNSSVTLTGFNVDTFANTTLRYTYWIAIGS